MADESELLTFQADGSQFLDVLAEIDQALSTISDALQTVADSAANLDELQTALDGITEATDSLSGGLDDLSGSLDAAISSLDDLAASADEAAANLDDVAASADTAGTATDAAGAGGFGGAKASLLLAGLAAYQAGKSFLSMGVDAQNSFSLVQGMAGVSSQELAQYQGQLDAMAQSLGVTMSDLGNGLYQVESAGYNLANGGLNVLRYSMMAAKAGGADMGTVSSALTSILHAYNASAQQAGYYTDGMVKAVVLGKQSFSDLASAIGPLAAVSHNVGISYNEMLAAEATMTQMNPNVRMDTNELRFLFNAMSLSVQGVADTAKKLKLHFNESQYASDDLIQRLQYLAQIAGGTNTEAFKKLAGGSAGMQAALALLSGHAKTFSGNLKQLASDSGSTAAAFAVSENTMAAHAEHLGATMSVISTKIVNALTPIANIIMDNIGTAFQFLAQHANIVIPAITALSIVLLTMLAPALWGMASAAFAAGAGLFTVTWPVLLVAAAIAGLVVGIMELVQHWKQVTQTLSNIGVFTVLRTVWDALESAAQKVWHVLQSIGSFLASLFIPLWQSLPSVFQGVLSAINTVWGLLQQLGSYLGSIFAPIWQQLVALWQTEIVPLGRQLGQAFSQLWASFQQLGAYLASTLAPVFAQLWPVLKMIWNALHPLVPVFEAIGAVIGVLLIVQLGILVGMLNGLVHAIATFIGGAITWISGFVQVIVGIVQIVSGILSLLIDLFTGHFGKLRGDLNVIWQGIQNIFAGGLKMLEGLFQMTIGTIISYVGGFIQGIIGFFVHLWDSLVGHSIVPDMCNAIVQWFIDLGPRALSAIENLVSQITQRFLSLTHGAVQWGEQLLQQFAQGIENGIGVVEHAVSGVWSKIASFFPHSPPQQGPGTDLPNWGPRTMQLYADGITSASSLVDNALNTALSGLSKRHHTTHHTHHTVHHTTHHTGAHHTATLATGLASTLDTVMKNLITAIQNLDHTLQAMSASTFSGFSNINFIGNMGNTVASMQNSGSGTLVLPAPSGSGGSTTDIQQLIMQQEQTNGLLTSIEQLLQAMVRNNVPLSPTTLHTLMDTLGGLAYENGQRGAASLW